jgi:hypothetical protein
LTDLRYPEWEKFYLDAVLETDDTKMLVRARHAEQAIHSRTQAIAGSIGLEEERLALEQAISEVRTLLFERLKSPPGTSGPSN